MEAHTSKAVRALVRPPGVRRGDKVGIFAPSSPLAARYGTRLRGGVAALAALLDVEVVVAGQADRQIDGHQAGSPADRAAALMAFVRDPGVTAVVATLGGYNSADILPYLDAAELRANPLALVGYSDVTSLLVGVQALAGWVTFHGPTLMTDFGEQPQVDPFTVRHFLTAVVAGHGRERWVLDDPDVWTDEFLDWGGTEWTRGRAPSGSGARQVWAGGTGAGSLFGGNLSTLSCLLGTPYVAIPPEMVFFFEATGIDAEPANLQRFLTHLRQAGALDGVRAVLVGRFAGPAGFGHELRDVVLKSFPAVPIVADLPFGHHSPIWTLPVGARVSVTADKPGSSIEVLGWS